MAPIVVLGGGLAGGSAALALAEAGLPVVLIEKRPRLGGRASSFQPPGWDHWVDNSQHVLLGCCTNLLDLYRRLGVAERIDWHDRLTLIDADGRRGVFRAGPLPPPLHLLPGLLALPGLGLRDRLRLGGAFGRMLPAARRLPELSGVNFQEWLGTLTTEHLDQGFWRLMLTSVLNAGADRVSARYALMFFLDGLMRNRRSFVMGVPQVPLGALHHDALFARLTALGAEMRQGETGTVELDGAGRRVAGVHLRQGVVAAEEVVCAVAWSQLGHALGDAAAAAVAGRAV
ncbi:MAG: FAD-dependent oxidoreductase, partial [Armatimonadetes bacterium]|nr:FAD-dependent oxidoreductase [Armatimonadota bacterium]